jgi:hypothetical protein
LIFTAFSARLKSFPDTSGFFIEFFAACEAVPFQNRFIDSFQSLSSAAVRAAFGVEALVG